MQMPPPDQRRQGGRSKQLVLNATITCPQCGFRKQEAMPTDACLHFYECVRCHTVLRPRAGDCCVFCSYGSAKCPPRQVEARL